MRAFVRSAVVAATLIAGIGASVPASGGGAVFHFERSYYAPGETARGSVSFGKGSVGLHMLDRGPFYAYLIPSGRWIDPPRIPTSAVPLGPMRIVPLGELCGGPCYRATVRFTVPDVPTGNYGVGYCNDPCTVDGIGELVGGGIAIYESHEEARIERKLDGLRQRVNAIRTNHRTLKRRVEARRHELELALADAREVKASLSDRVARLRGEVAAARADRGGGAWLWATGWIVAAALVVARLIGMARHRPSRRRRAPIGPQLQRAAPPERELEPVP